MILARFNKFFCSTDNPVVLLLLVLAYEPPDGDMNPLWLERAVAVLEVDGFDPKKADKEKCLLDARGLLPGAVELEEEDIVEASSRESAVIAP